MPTQLYMYVCMKCSHVFYYWTRAQIDYFSLPLDVLYSCTDVRNIIGSDKLRVTARHEDATGNTPKEILQ